MSTSLANNGLRQMMCSIFVVITLCRAVANAQTEVWISAVPISGGGSGTASNPYDGSTQAKFDALMASFQWTSNLTIHLGAGTFRSNIALPNRWWVRTGWIIQGAGMYSTTCQMMGSLHNVRWDVGFFKSNSTVSTDGVIIRDLTIDCNWPELSVNADTVAGGEKWGLFTPSIWLAATI